ncbi:MAG: NADP-dependent malic enzyme [Hyphomicrobiales bacterium]|nr:NADP-dependent malic enzyme [Hyphomicrobiales bacterium]
MAKTKNTKSGKSAKSKVSFTDDDALHFHSTGKPGKIQISATKPLLTQRDLSLAYSPGVAVPCKAIHKDPSTAYQYTSKGNFIAVISNGTAVLGLGNLGALASKPVMEGKAVLFKRFADIDGIDLEVDAEDPQKFIDAVRYLGPSFGGINLEDIKAPDCFIIEQKLREVMDIPIFHDDQHGTAIITAAGLINAAHLTGRKLKDIKLVVLGAGSAGIACIELVKALGVRHENVLLIDREGVVYKGREKGMNQWKTAHAVDTKARTLADAMKGADAFYGLAGPGSVTQKMVASMAQNPIIFAMANPEPEIRPELIREVRDDAIIATGRSDYNNQVNNVLGFPYIFRGALDVHASTINEDMKIAAANALAELARQPVPDEVASAYGGRKMQFGPDYIIPVPFDPRLISTIPVAVAKAAMDSGVARKPIANFDKYRAELSARLNPTANTMNFAFQRAKENPKTMLFAEGEEEKVVRAAHQWVQGGYGKAILVGREEKVKEVMRRSGIKPGNELIEIRNAAKTQKDNDKYIDYMYSRLQRKGYLRRDCTRFIKNDRNFYATSLLALGDADAMITGLTRTFPITLRTVMKMIDARPNKRIFGLTMVLMRDKRTVFIADTAVDPTPSPENLANIAIQTAEKVRQMGEEPRVALLSFANFGNPLHQDTQRITDAVSILDSMKVDFEYEGEMAADVALNQELMELFPFCRLTGPANILVMPGLHSANISYKLLRELGGGTVIGPVLCGFEKPVQITQPNASVSAILNLAAIAAAEAENKPQESVRKPAKKATRKTSKKGRK